jgi:type IV secretory pathway protease TraF
MQINSIEQLHEKQLEDFTIVVATTKTCTVCTHAKGMVERMIQSTPLSYYTIDIDDVPLFRGEHLVFTVPTVLVFSHGKELYRSSRFIDYGALQKLIQRYLN